VLHEIMPGTEFHINQFTIVVGESAICTQSPTASPTAPPPPVYLPGPTATVDVSYTTDSETNVTDISYTDACNFNETYVVSTLFVSHDDLEANSTYNYSFTLPEGKYSLLTHDHHLKFLGSIIFSSDGIVLHEIRSGLEFHFNEFWIIVGDGGICDNSGAIRFTILFEICLHIQSLHQQTRLFLLTNNGNHSKMP
jgi:hypothetical protein